MNVELLERPEPETAEKLEARKRRVLILANPRAGARKSRRCVEALVGALHGRGLSPVLCWEREELSALVKGDGTEDLRCIVAAGGDGTLLEVLNRAPGVPVALLPLGNENLVARFCGLGRSPGRAADVIVDGRLRRVDLGRVNGRLFCLMASSGFDAEVVRRVHARRKGHINKLSYLVPILQSLGTYAYPSIEVEIEDSGERLRGAQALVFNIPRYALGLPLAPGARPDDGLLDVYVFEHPGTWNLFRYLAAVGLGCQDRLSDFQHRTAKRVRLSSSGRAPLQIDGDPAGWLPAVIDMIPQSLTLLTARI
jgi:diacylglycerol kinase family enzyme